MKINRKNAGFTSTPLPASSNEANAEPNITFALKAAVSLGAGLVFGFAAEKARGEQPIR